MEDKVNKKKKLGGRRKRSPSIHNIKRPRLSKRFKELWADPEWRAKHSAKLEAGRLAKQAARHAVGDFSNPKSRFGIPDGMRRPEAKRALALAREQAEKTMEDLEKAGVIPTKEAATTDEQAAREALETSLVIMRMQIDQKVRLAAANTVLAYTKSKPASKVEAAIDTAEAWLAAVAKANEKDEGDAGGAEASS